VLLRLSFSKTDGRPASFSCLASANKLLAENDKNTFEKSRISGSTDATHKACKIPEAGSWAPQETIMKRLVLVAALLAGPALATPASAVQFTLSDAFGTGDFGSATAFFKDATTVHVDITMAPNFVVDTGSHWALSLSLLGTGRIVESSFNLVNGVDVFTAQPHLAVANYSNSPFGKFTDAVAGACGSGGSSLCGSAISFDISNFQGFGAATTLFDPAPDGGPTFPIYAALDVFRPAPCTGGCTGVVGLTSPLVPTEFSAVPGPIVGAGLPGLIAGCFGLLGLAHRRRRRQLA
jgi:hypothetical protein